MVGLLALEAFPVPRRDLGARLGEFRQTLFTPCQISSGTLQRP
jgi:hypothetical protein